MKRIFYHTIEALMQKADSFGSTIKPKKDGSYYFRKGGVSYIFKGRKVNE